MRNILCFFIGLISFSFNTAARPLTPADQGYQTILDKADYEFLADGQTKARFQRRYKVVSEIGVQSFNLYQIGYNTNTQTLTVGKVEVINPEGVTVIDSKNIEEKSLFGGHSGYDETKTKVIPLPNIKVGSEISVQYEQTQFHPPFPGVISDRIMLSSSTEVTDFQVTLTGPDGMQSQIHDPSGSLKDAVSNSKTAQGSVVKIALKNMKGIGVAAETASIPPEENLAWIDVTNLASFEAAGQKASLGFDKVLNVPMPKRWEPLFGPKPIAPLDKATAMKRMTEILTTISDNFRYFGDWRSVDGGFIPRALAEIDRTGYGDCKDFSVLTVTAARYLGLDADAALVYRDPNPFQIATIPNLGIYNHAIARVKIPGEDGSWWIDATNRIPQVGLVPQDIAGRDALVLGKSSGKVAIPRDGSKMATQDITLTMNPAASPDDAFTVKIEIAGQLGWIVKNQLRGKSPQQLQEYLTGFLGVDLPDAKNFKLIKNDQMNEFPYTLAFSYEVTEQNGIARSGDLKILPVITFGDPHIRIMDAVPEERGSDLTLDILKHVTVVETIAPGSYKEVVGVPQSCDIKSPWLNYSRTVTTTPEFTITDRYDMLDYKIPLTRIKSPEFLAVQKQLRDCLNGVRVVVR